MGGEDANTELLILQAHDAHDNKVLAEIYFKTAMLHERDNLNKYCFLLTNAYVCALEAGLDVAHDIHARLVRQGRET